MAGLGILIASDTPWQHGKQDISNHAALVNQEVQDRVAVYKQQAQTWIEEGKFGAARLAAEKALLLKPEDDDTLKLLDEIKAHRAQQAKEPHETGKAL